MPSDDFVADIRDLGEASGPTAVSPKGAYGTMQVMPATAANPGFGIAPASGPQDYERVGQEYARALLDKYGSPILASAAYNAGPGAVDGWIKEFGDPRESGNYASWVKSIPYAETRNYVARVNKLPLSGLSDDSANFSPNALESSKQDIGTSLVTSTAPSRAYSQVSNMLNPDGTADLKAMLARRALDQLVPPTHKLEPVDYDPWKYQPGGATAHVG